MFVVSDQGTSTPFLYIGGNGRVSIGTTTTNSTLTVFNSTTADVTEILIDTGLAQASVQTTYALRGVDQFSVGVHDGDLDKFKISAGGTLGTTDRFVIDSSGNVGIGTSSPYLPLSVAGSGVFGGTSTASAFVATSTTASSTFANGLNLTGGCFALSGTCISAAGSNIWQDTSGVVNLVTSSNNVTIGGSSNFAKLAVDGDADEIQFLVQGHSVQNLDLLVVENSGLTDLFVVNSSGQVGIGTGGPANDLEVDTGLSGGIDIEYDNGALNFGELTFKDAGGDLWSIISWPHSSNLAGSTQNAGDLTFGTTSPYSLVLDRSGSVGVGSTTPWGTLSVEATSTGPMFVVSDEGTSTPFLIVDGRGYIGIGTSTPSEKLTIDGNILFGSTAARTISIQKTASGAGQSLSLTAGAANGGNTVGGAVVITGGGGAGLAAGGAVTVVAGAGFNGGSVTINPTGGFTTALNGYIALGNTIGNVGVGMTSPLYKLEVQTSSSTSYAARVYNTNTGTDADGLLISLGVANASRTTGNYFVGFSTADGTVAGKIQGGASAVAYTTTGADLAEYFRFEGFANTPTSGDVVMLDASQRKTVVRAVSGSGVAIGVVSTNPGFIGNGPICEVNDKDCDVNYEKYNVLVALSGQVPVKISNADGSVAPGDSLTPSDIAGYARKAKRGDQVIGIALESSGATATSTVAMLVNLGHANLDEGVSHIATGESGWTVDTNGRMTARADVDMNSQSILGVAGIVSATGDWSITADGRFKTKQIVAETIDADRITAKRFSILNVADASENTIGAGRILRGDTSTTIYSKYISANSKIFVTFTNDLGGRSWYIAEKQGPTETGTTEGMFRIAISSASPDDLNFDWWVVDTAGDGATSTSISTDGNAGNGRTSGGGNGGQRDARGGTEVPTPPATENTPVTEPASDPISAPTADPTPGPEESPTVESSSLEPSTTIEEPPVNTDTTPPEAPVTDPAPIPDVPVEPIAP